MDEQHHRLCDECAQLRRDNVKLLELAAEVAKEYPDAADWKDARARLAAMAGEFGAFDMDDEFDEEPDDFQQSLRAQIAWDGTYDLDDGGDADHDR